jgi:hypothetical protein
MERLLLASVVVVSAIAVAAALALRTHGDGGGAGAAPSTGCVQLTAPYGYPDWYFSRQLVPTVHPPALAPGWRGPTERVPFDVLFHSIFHGYVVVQYRADLAPQKLALLRSWVQGNAGRRVMAAPGLQGSKLAIHVGRWGYELRCTSTARLTTARLDRFLALRPPPP